jgi:hypothetical protein
MYMDGARHSLSVFFRASDLPLSLSRDLDPGATCTNRGLVYLLSSDDPPGSFFLLFLRQCHYGAWDSGVSGS